jgi:non-specific protein-tyrosine kinase
LQQGYLNIIRRWLWLIILSTLLSAFLTFWISSQQPASYTASARLVIGPGIDSPNPDLNALRAGAQLMQTYAELPTTGPFLQTIINRLNLDMTIEELRENISLSANQETQILKVDGRASNPEQAVAITNAIAETLVLLSPTGANNPSTQLRSQILEQTERIEQNIAAIESNIGQLEAEFQAATDLAEQRLIRDNISQEREQILDSHGTLAQLYEMLQTETTNRVEIIEPANAAGPVSNQLQLKVIIGAMVGMVLSFLVVFAFEYLNDSVVDVEQLTRASDSPVLGAIARHKRLRGIGRERIAIQALPRSAAAENYRMLGTKLLYLNNYLHLQSVMLSAVGLNDDSGELAANLAMVLSQTGSRVVLVDANLHQPTMGELFDIRDRPGLTDYLTGQAEAMEMTPIDWAPGLSVLPSGPVNYNSFALLASPRMSHLLNKLEEMNDIVIVVASPILSFADSLFLATRVDGVILLARSGKTEGDMVRDSVASLKMVGAALLGSVLFNSRDGSVQIAPLVDRQSMAARHTQDLLQRTNGRKQPAHAGDGLSVDGNSSQSSASKPSRNPERQ